MNKARRDRLVFWSVAAIALILASLLRFYRIESAPAGFFGDESSEAYNAYCVALTGADEYGVKHPLLFRGFGEYKNPVMIYSMVPFLKLFGPQRWAARLPSGLYLMAAAIGFGFLVKGYFDSKWLSLVAGFAFTLLPWVFAGSRAVNGYVPMVAGMMFGWLLLVWTLKRRSYGCAAAAGVIWGLTMYTYPVSQPMSVLILFCFGVAYYPELKSCGKVGMVFLVSWVGMLIPMMATIAFAPQAITHRFGTISIFYDQPTWRVAFTRFASRYVEYFGPRFLFLTGDENLRQHSGCGGELFLFLSPLIFVGVYCLVRRWNSQPNHRFVGLGLLIYPAAAALTMDRMHAPRSINGVIFWAITAVIGAYFLWQKRGAGRNLLILVCCAGAVEVGIYIKDYLGQYPVRCRSAFDADFTETLEDCFRNLKDSETLYISGSTFAPMPHVVDQDFKPWFYASILFLGKIDPHTYQQTGIPKDRVCLYEGATQKPGLLLRCNLRLERPPMPDEPSLYSVNLEPIPVGARLMETKALNMPLDLTQVPELHALKVQYEVYRVK